MRYDARDAIDPIHAELFANQRKFEEKVLKIGNQNKRRKELTRYTIKQGDRVVEEAWELGALLWTKYDEKF